MSQASRETEKSEASCSFCERESGSVAKFISDCDGLICLRCYAELNDHLAESRKFKCRACGEYHTMPQSGYSNCCRLPRKVEKALPPQAKELEALIKNVQERLDKLQEFEARDLIEQECERLELEVSETAERAVKHIDKVEKDLFRQIKEYRRRCLGALAADSLKIGQLQASIRIAKSKLDPLAKEIDEFRKKWTDRFLELNYYTKRSEIEDALDRAKEFDASIEKFVQEVKKNALNGSLMKFNANRRLFLETHLLGTLVETTKRKDIEIQEMLSKTLAGHSDEVIQAVFLPDARLASCSNHKTIKVWDTARGQELFTLSGHEQTVLTLAVLANGWLASGSIDETIKLWDLDERKEVKLSEDTPERYFR